MSDGLHAADQQRTIQLSLIQSVLTGQGFQCICSHLVVKINKCRKDETEHETIIISSKKKKKWDFWNLAPLFVALFNLIQKHFFQHCIF